MDLIPQGLRQQLEMKRDEVLALLEKLEKKQKDDVTQALTGNLINYLDFKEYIEDKNVAESLTETKKKEIYEKLVVTSLEKKNTSHKPAKVKAAMKSKTELAKLLYEKEYIPFKCSECRNRDFCKNH